MADELFAEVKNEGATLDIDKAFERLSTKEDTTASDSQPEKKETDEPIAQKGDNDSEEKTPFHKHPRWIKTQQDLKEAKEKLAALEGTKSEGQSELPKWWKDQYGEDEESKQRYQAVTQKDGELDWIKQNIKDDLKRETQAEKTQAADADEYVDTQLTEMSDEGLKFDRNSLLKFMVDFQEEFGAGSLLDGEGNYDFRKALTMQNRMQTQAEPDNTRKQLAAQAGRSKGAGQTATKIPVVSTRALRKGGWRDAGI